MWQRAKLLGCPPSRLLRVRDELAAYLLDSAVVTLGIIFENALEERVNVGTSKQANWRPKYALAELLDERFVLPRPPKREPQSGVAALLALAGKAGGGIKVFRKQGESG